MWASKTPEIAQLDEELCVLFQGFSCFSVEKYVQYKLIPSFFTQHTYLFADAHLANRGKDQAYFVSPMRTAIDLGLRPTDHTDYGVAPIDQMATIWSAVNRLSRTGEVIGPDQRVTPLEGLKAITINAAHQYKEESTKGTLESGKLADLVDLGKNPLKVEAMTIKDIKVVETIKEGNLQSRLIRCGIMEPCPKSR